MSSPAKVSLHDINLFERQLKIRELRIRAQQKLGPRFDIRKFHDEILNAGSLPMDMLDARINGWIKNEQATGEKSEQPKTRP